MGGRVAGYLSIIKGDGDSEKVGKHCSPVYFAYICWKEMIHLKIQLSPSNVQSYQKVDRFQPHRH